MANHTKGPRPWTVGNKSRTGMPRPIGSGSQALEPGAPTTSFTFRVPCSELKKWKVVSEEMGVTVGSLVRNAVRDYIEDMDG